MATVVTSTPINVARSASTRFVSDAGWLVSTHSSSCSAHDEASNSHHGVLLVHNDRIVSAGTIWTPARAATWGK